MQKKKSGVKKCLEICAIKGGGGRRLMAKTILNFHFDYLTTSLRSILRREIIIAAPLLLLLNLELIDFALETLTPPCSCYWTNPAKLTRSERACLKAGSAASTERQARTWACVREEVFFPLRNTSLFLPSKYTLG